MYHLQDDVTHIKYVGISKGEVLHTEGIHKVIDLLNYFPRKYKDTSHVVSVSTLIKEMRELPVFSQITLPFTFQAKVIAQKFFITRTRKMFLELQLADEQTGQVVKAIWFNQPYIRKALEEGTHALFYGKAVIKGKDIVFYNPEHEVIRIEKKNIHIGRLTPVYKSIKSVSTSYIRRFEEELKDTITEFEEFLPQSVQKKYDLINLQLAYKQIHHPNIAEDIEIARKRLAIQELLELKEHFEKIYEKAAVGTYKLSMAEKDAALILGGRIKQLPFKLTKSQSDAVDQLLSLLGFSKKSQEVFMYGDVGSGKTVVAALMASLFLASGLSVVIMAPTTILAEQHFATFKKLFDLWEIDSEAYLSLVTSSRKVISSERASCIIGTHALLYNSFKNITVGLVVVDEQHRFGVEQREALRHQFTVDGKRAHLLSLSATPIPRTLAQVFYGFSETIYLKERPFESDNIKTRLVPPAKINDLYTWIAEKVRAKKERVFLVFPIIEESEALEVTALKAVYETLTEEFFKGCKVGILHGRMKDKEKLSIMDQFKNGEVEVLFATPVIEVGIDVPEASIMVIHNADHFGLAQLHQLRGRVGRDGREAYCFVTQSIKKEEADERLVYFGQHNDGLSLATYDLEHRGPGELYGTAQAGIPQLKIADVTNYSTVRLAVEIYKLLKQEKVKITPYIMNNEKA